MPIISLPPFLYFIIISLQFFTKRKTPNFQKINGSPNPSPTPPFHSIPFLPLNPNPNPKPKNPFPKSSQNMTNSGIDLECGGGVGGGETSHHHHIRRSTSDDNQCFSDAEEGSCYSQFYSTYGDANYDDPEIGRVSRRVSDCSVDVHIIGDDDGDEGKIVIVHLGKKLERDCRICHLSLVDNDDGDDDGNDAMELGCCCKDDLALAHKHCAETWFKIKGNKTCEICNSIVSNLVVPNETPMSHGTIDVNPAATSVATAHVSAAAIRGTGRGCINGHRLLNFILACLVFAFVISWLFHFNIPS